MDDLISEEDFRVLRVQLEVQQEKYLSALQVMAESHRKGLSIEDALRKLGIITFWLHLPQFTVLQAADVRHALTTFHVEV